MTEARKIDWEWAALEAQAEVSRLTATLDEMRVRAEAAEARAVPLVQALLAAAPHHQGAHGVVGKTIAAALGVPHPIRVPDLIALVDALAIEPPDVWPWEPEHAARRAARAAAGDRT